jgi:hypothetical protein
MRVVRHIVLLLSSSIPFNLNSRHAENKSRHTIRKNVIQYSSSSNEVDNITNSSSATIPFFETSSSRRKFIEKNTIFIGATSLISTSWINRAMGQIPIVDDVGSSASTFNPTDKGTWDSLSSRVHTTLGRQRLLTQELSPLQASSWLDLLNENEVYFPSYLFGTWNVTATLRRISFPYGTEYESSLFCQACGYPLHLADTVGQSTSFQLRYFSTIANTWRNQLTVNLGIGVPSTKIIQDRAYNIKSMSKVCQHCNFVDVVEWDYREHPDRLVLHCNSGSSNHGNSESMDEYQTEIFFKRQKTEAMNIVSKNEQLEAQCFAIAELSQSIATTSKREVVVKESEIITEYLWDHIQHPKGDVITAISRIALFLPQSHSNDHFWQQVRGNAVALYDYEMVLHQVRENFFYGDGTSTRFVDSRACVETPRGIIQCS